MATSPQSCGVELYSDNLLNSLLAGTSIEVPVIDLDSSRYEIPASAASQLYGTVKSVRIGDVTSGEVDGSGAFDILLRAVSAQLGKEYEKGRITGAEYTKAYSNLVQTAIQQSVQFVLEKDKQFWENQLAQITAIQGVIALDQARMQLAELGLKAHTTKTDYATAKIRLALTNQEFCKARWEVEDMLPIQKTTAEHQRDKTREEKDILAYQRMNNIPSENTLLQKQALVQEKQAGLIQEQTDLVSEQIITQIAQTKDTIGGNPVGGYIGKQLSLYDEQITAYKNDTLIKAAQVRAGIYNTNSTVNGNGEPMADGPLFGPNFPYITA